MRGKLLRAVAFVAAFVFVAVSAAPAFAGGARVKVRRGDVIITVATGQSCALVVRSTPGGLLIDPDGGTVNGQTAPLEFEGPFRDLRVRFRRAKHAQILIGALDHDEPPLELRDVDVGGAAGYASVSLKRVNVAGTVRSRLGAFESSSGIHLDGCSVAGSVLVSGGGLYPGFSVRDTRIEGALRTRLVVGRPVGRVGGEYDEGSSYTVSDCEIGSLRLDGQGHVGADRLRVVRSTVRGETRVRSGLSFRAEDLVAEGDVTLLANVGRQGHQFTGCVVSGRTTIVTGADVDTVLAWSCQLGVLSLRTGAGNDTLFSRELQVATGSVFDGSSGSNDRWDDATELDPDLVTIGVESVPTTAP